MSDSSSSEQQGTGEPAFDIEQRFALKESIVRLRRSLGEDEDGSDAFWPSDVEAVLEEIDRLMLVNGQISKLWCDAEDRAPIPETDSEEANYASVCEKCGALAVLAGRCWRCNPAGDSGEATAERTTGPGAWLRRLAERFDRLLSADPYSPYADKRDEYGEAFHDAVHALKDLRQFAAIIAPTWSAASSPPPAEPELTRESLEPSARRARAAVDLSELLDRLESAARDMRNWIVGETDGGNWPEMRRRRDAARSEILSLFQRLQEENERLNSQEANYLDPLGH